MNFAYRASIAQFSVPWWRRISAPENLLLAAGLAALILPTMFQVARDSWSTEQGGHGPLVLATGLWAVWRELKGKGVKARRGRLVPSLICLALCLTLFILARITSTLEVEAYAIYGAVISAIYMLKGPSLLRAIWFPLIYLAFTLPPPDAAVAAVTQPIKIAISSWVVLLLYNVGYPIASSGVTIHIGQYQLLMAAACAGLNSILTLTALCLFYVYLRHRSNPTAILVTALAAVPVAVASNFVRVIVLVLVTYHFGDAAAQGYVHDFAGLLMFAVALLTMFAIDSAAEPLYRGRKAKAAE